MRANLVVVTAPGLDRRDSFGAAAEVLHLRHWSRKRPLKLSSVPFARCDMRRLDAFIREPARGGGSNERGPVVGANHLTEFTAETTAALRSDANVRNAGVALPNITDGFTGPAPDIGAVIGGRPVPRWGAKRP